jgi:hypothetical protein
VTPNRAIFWLALLLRSSFRCTNRIAGDTAWQRNDRSQGLRCSDWGSCRGVQMQLWRCWWAECLGPNRSSACRDRLWFIGFPAWFEFYFFFRRQPPIH